MKRTIGLLLVATLAFALMAGPATAKKKKKVPTQEYHGSIMLAAPYPADGTCYSRLERTLAWGGDAAIGFVGSHFDVDPRTYGRPFQLHVLEGSADVDLDIIFYMSYGESDPSTVPAYVAYEHREAGGEVGTVPEGMTKAIVCMTAGQESEFHYMTTK